MKGYITLSQTSNSKLKEFADDYNKFDENSIKLAKWVENTEGKGETSNFSFSSVFSKGLSCRPVKTRACLGKG